MLLVSAYKTVLEPSRSLIIWFTIGMIIAAFIIGIVVLARIRKTSVTTSKYLLVGIGLMAILFSLGRAVLLYHDYYASDEWDIFFWKIGSALVLAGLTSLAFTIEKFMFPKTKKLITIIGVACLVLIFFMDKTIATILLYVGNITVMLLPFCIYIYLAKISTGSGRRSALIIILGMILVLIGQLGGAVIFNLLKDMLASQLFGIFLSLFGLIFLAIGFIKTIAASSSR